MNKKNNFLTKFENRSIDAILKLTIHHRNYLVNEHVVCHSFVGRRQHMRVPRHLNIEIGILILLK